MSKIRFNPSHSGVSVCAGLFVLRRSRLWFVAVSAALVAASCVRASEETLMDRSFITGKPCAAPCWYGLELDVSNKDDVIAALDRLPFVDQASIGEFGTAWLEDENAIGISYGCLHPRVIRM